MDHVIDFIVWQIIALAVGIIWPCVLGANGVIALTALLSKKIRYAYLYSGCVVLFYLFYIALIFIFDRALLQQHIILSNIIALTGALLIFMLGARNLYKALTLRNGANILKTMPVNYSWCGMLLQSAAFTLLNPGILIALFSFFEFYTQHNAHLNKTYGIIFLTTLSLARILWVMIFHRIVNISAHNLAKMSLLKIEAISSLSLIAIGSFLFINTFNNFLK